MKYVLVDSSNDVVGTVDSTTISTAEDYFIGRKQFVDRDTFYSLYRILTRKEYELNQEAFIRKPSSEWWAGEERYLDIDKQ